MLAFSLLAVGGVVITGQVVGRSLFLSALPPWAIPFRFLLPPVSYTHLTLPTNREV